jgi:hypothetical protein
MSARHDSHSQTGLSNMAAHLFSSSKGTLTSEKDRAGEGCCPMEPPLAQAIPGSVKFERGWVKVSGPLSNLGVPGPV